MGACVSSSRTSEGGTSSSRRDGQRAGSRKTKGSNPAAVLNLGTRCESYFADCGGREFYAQPPVTKQDSSPDSSPETLTETDVTFESNDGTLLAGVLHRMKLDKFANGEGKYLYSNSREIGSFVSAASPYTFRTRSRRNTETDRDTSNNPNAPAKGCGVVLCHPHPFLGGSKDSPLLVSLARRLAQDGVTVLRFDSRGVGDSDGKRTWMRDAEREDTQAAVKRVAKIKDVDVGRVYVVGYGLGAAIALETVKREPSAAGFVGISYPFGAKSMLVPGAASVTRDPRERNKRKTPKLFIVASNDVVGNAGDADFVASYAKKLPAPRAVVVVDDAQHAWDGFYGTLHEHVLEWLLEQSTKENNQELAIGHSVLAMDPGVELDECSPFQNPEASRKYKPNNEWDGNNSGNSENDHPMDSASTDDGFDTDFDREMDREFHLHMGKAAGLLDGNEDTSNRGSQHSGSISDDTLHTTNLNKEHTPAEVLGWEREVRSRARAVGSGSVGGRPLGPLRAIQRRDERQDERRDSEYYSGDESVYSESAYSESAYSDVPTSPTGAQGEGGFETWEAWEREKKRREKLGSPGHTPAASLGSTPWQTPGHSPGHTPTASRSVVSGSGDDEDNARRNGSQRVARDTSTRTHTSVDPWSINCALPLIQRDGSFGDVPTKAAEALAAFSDKKGPGSKTGSDVSVAALSRASNRPRTVPMHLAQSTSHSNTDSKASTQSTSRGSNGNVDSPSNSRPGSVVGIGRVSGDTNSTIATNALKKPILKKTSSYGNLGGVKNSVSNSSLSDMTPPDPEAPSLIKAFTNASTKLHGRPNLFRSGIRAVLAANRFVAAGKKRVQWEETTAEGRPILDAVLKKPTRVGGRSRMRSAAKAVMAGNRLRSFAKCSSSDKVGDTSKNKSPLRGQFLQKTPEEERQFAAARHRLEKEKASARRESVTFSNGSRRSDRSSNSSPSRSPGSSQVSARGESAEGRGREKQRFTAAARAVVAGARVRDRNTSGAGAGAGAGAMGYPQLTSQGSRSPSLRSRSPERGTRSGSLARYSGSQDMDSRSPSSRELFSRESDRESFQSTRSLGPRGSPSSSLRSTRDTLSGSRTRSRSGF